MADMTTIKGRIQETIYPNGTGAITAESHQALLLEMVDDINAKKADKEEITAVAESVSMLSQEVESNYNNFTESLDALEQKVDNLPQGGGNFDAEGNYPLLHVGTADDLAGRGESVPASFGFRASGGKSIKDGRAYIKAIKGNSVVWNQQSSGESLGGDNGTTKALPQGARIVQGHKYLILCDKVVNSELYLYYNDGEGKTLTYLKAVSYKFIESSVSFTANGQANTEGSMWWYLTNASANDARPRLIDLTQMFQAGNEPSTIEDFYARVATLGVDLNAYNEGEVIHCNTESIKSIGDNAWDEEWELGAIDANTGEVISGDFVMPSNYIKVLPNEQYVYTDVNYLAYGELFCYDADKNYIGRSVQVRRENAILTFRTLPNCSYILFRLISSYGTTYKHDILISLYHSGWKAQKDDQYQPYWQDILPLPIIRKYFPDGMKKAGSAHDEIRYNKVTQKWEMVQRIGSVDMGTLGWQKAWYNEEEGYRLFCSLPSKAIGRDNIICRRYVTQRINKTEGDRGIDGNPVNTTIYIKDTSFATQGADALISSLQGVILYYELAEPIVTELDTEDQNFRDYYNVADFGTEQSQSNVPSAPFSADIIYQFNAVDMIREHEIEITELQSIIATMQAQLTSLINGGQ